MHRCVCAGDGWAHNQTFISIIGTISRGGIILPWISNNGSYSLGDWSIRVSNSYIHVSASAPRWYLSQYLQSVRRLRSRSPTYKCFLHGLPDNNSCLLKFKITVFRFSFFCRFAKIFLSTQHRVPREMVPIMETTPTIQNPSGRSSPYIIKLFQVHEVVFWPCLGLPCFETGHELTWSSPNLPLLAYYIFTLFLFLYTCFI